MLPVPVLAITLLERAAAKVLVTCTARLVVWLEESVSIAVATTPLAECERRDPKGMYAKARSGKLSGLTGIDAPYEAPQNPDLVLGASGESLETSAQTLLDAINVHLNLKH